ncbi:uncharacterized protein BJ171DRAFT_53909 [Polychytrium aggregatum]|uniref:uncharacterized protein n=1 Tax=Polychytrium aggregatum TaxID=110093 RepID=UPI0022FE3EE2|nr:uncharacterized protein BJ171DRAFT_53909 [Polychytrium aggregatum]KAI9205842.1 hypothetical protein BJ171DRAFT_53909 [Polychytrium aggregatum]
MQRFLRLLILVALGEGFLPPSQFFAGRLPPPRSAVGLDGRPSLSFCWHIHYNVCTLFQKITAGHSLTSIEHVF